MADMKYHQCLRDERYELRDAAGIFCCYVCAQCEQAKRSRFNASIFESGTRYSTTGEEDDIGIEEDFG